MTRLARHLSQLDTVLPPPPAAPQPHDLGRLTAAQRVRYRELGERYQAVGITGLTDTELEEIAELVGILEREPEP